MTDGPSGVITGEMHDFKVEMDARMSKRFGTKIESEWVWSGGNDDLLFVWKGDPVPSGVEAYEPEADGAYYPEGMVPFLVPTGETAPWGAVTESIGDDGTMVTLPHARLRYLVGADWQPLPVGADSSAATVLTVGHAHSGSTGNISVTTIIAHDIRTRRVFSTGRSGISDDDRQAVIDEYGGLWHDGDLSRPVEAWIDKEPKSTAASIDQATDRLESVVAPPMTDPSQPKGPDYQPAAPLAPTPVAAPPVAPAPHAPKDAVPPEPEMTPEQKRDYAAARDSEMFATVADESLTPEEWISDELADDYPTDDNPADPLAEPPGNAPVEHAPADDLGAPLAAGAGSVASPIVKLVVGAMVAAGLAIVGFLAFGGSEDEPATTASSTSTAASTPASTTDEAAPDTVEESDVAGNGAADLGELATDERITASIGAIAAPDLGEDPGCIAQGFIAHPAMSDEDKLSNLQAVPQLWTDAYMMMLGDVFEACDPLINFYLSDPAGFANPAFGLTPECITLMAERTIELPWTWYHVVKVDQAIAFGSTFEAETAIFWGQVEPIYPRVGCYEGSGPENPDG